jgi:ubiquinone/menaquinone biosynthesis C-methylase UbiE
MVAAHRSSKEGMVERRGEVWKQSALVRTFLDGIRGGIPFGAEQIEVMLRVIEACGVAVTHVADLGCGSGVLARALLTRYPSAQATLVDFSEPMLDAARAQLGRHVPPPRFIAADLNNPDWVDTIADRAPFDVVVSGYAIHHLPHERKRALYREIYARLTPGGMFVNIEHVASRTGWIEAISDELMIESLYAFHAAQGSGKTREQVTDEFVRRPDKAANILAPVEAQCEWLRDIGYADVDCYFKVFELAVFGGRRAKE